MGKFLPAINSVYLLSIYSVSGYSGYSPTTLRLRVLLYLRRPGPGPTTPSSTGSVSDTTSPASRSWTLYN